MSERDIILAAPANTDRAERAAFLADVCAGDAALCKWIERLLCADGRPDDFLEAPAIALSESRV
jgi:hypothetical protein